MVEQKKKIAVVFGGKSPEHEVSILSARSIIQSLDRKKFELLLVGISLEGTWYQLRSDTLPHNLERLNDDELPNLFSPITWVQQRGKPWIYRMDDHQLLSVDLAFPILHGSYGEDGAIQGFFESIGLAYAGSGVLGSAVGMDKFTMKQLLTRAKLPVGEYRLITKEAPIAFSQLVQDLGLPFFIKPSSAGSSVGVHKIKSEEQFQSDLEDAFKYDQRVLAEKALVGREIECSVLGPNTSPRASLPGEVKATHEFYSYEAKYLDDKGATFHFPADLAPPVQEKIMKLACDSFKVLEADGFARMDFFLLGHDEIYINEINTLPGFTKISMYPKMWESSGLDITSLLTEIVKFGLERFQKQQKLQRSFQAKPRS